MEEKGRLRKGQKEAKTDFEETKKQTHTGRGGRTERCVAGVGKERETEA